jgi:hypothetical protein
MAAGPRGVTCSRIAAAFPALISRPMPPAPGRTAPRAAGSRPGYGPGPGHGAVSPGSSAPRRGPRRPPDARPSTVARRPPPSRRHPGRSCGCSRTAAAAPGRPISALPPFAPDHRIAAGMPHYSAGARASFEPRRGTARQAGTSLSSQATSVTGRPFGSQPTGPLQRYGPAHFHPGQGRNATGLNSAGLCAPLKTSTDHIE